MARSTDKTVEYQPEMLVTIPGTMRRLGGLSHAMVYQLINSGDLVKVSIGRRSLITAESIAAYVERLKEAAAVEAASGLRGQRHRELAQERWARAAKVGAS